MKRLPVMHVLLIYLLNLSTLILSQSLTVAPAVIATAAGFKSSTLGVPEPPEDFDITYEIGGPKLRVTSCLMNAVAALKDIALRDWDSKIADGTEYRLESYPEVSIIVTTSKRKRNIQSRLVLWAICLGLYEMIARKKFEFAQFEMSWQRHVLGWVQVVNHPNSAGSITEESQLNATLGSGTTPANSSVSNHAIEPGPINITTVVTPDNADDPIEARLNVTFEPFGESLTVYDIFVPIMSGLTDMAKIPSTYQSSALIVGLEGFEGIICIMPVIPFRSSPPYLLYGWLIRTVARIPTYMLEKGRFGEVSMKIEVDEVIVGFGRLSMKPNCDEDTVLSPWAGVAVS